MCLACVCAEKTRLSLTKLAFVTANMFRTRAAILSSSVCAILADLCLRIICANVVETPQRSITIVYAMRTSYNKELIVFVLNHLPSITQS